MRSQEKQSLKEGVDRSMRMNLLKGGERSLPLVVTPEQKDHVGSHISALVAWTESNSGSIHAALLKHGALLFRGFWIEAMDDFETFIHALDSEFLAYIEGFAPRTKLSNAVYTSTEYPAEFSISLHNELSYAHKWPTRLFFCCLTAADEGGETPIADCRQILRTLPSKIVERFENKGVKYVQNLHGGYGVGKSWQATFETDDPSVVEKYLTEGGVEFLWREDGGLKFSQVRPGIAFHPETGEKLWFNQAEQWHPSSLDTKTRQAMLELMGEEELPLNAYFGDGTPLLEEDLEVIRDTFWRNAATFPWAEGDILIIDNMLVAHGRRPYRGERKVLLAMS